MNILNEKLKEVLPLYGHRNWIVVADAAYPAQSKPGIETIAVACDLLQIVQQVRNAIGAQSHVRANLYVDAELEYVAESDAPGVGEYCAQLYALLGAERTTMLHEQIIAKLDQAAETFRVLIVKSSFTIPYTSVCFELDCGYWTAEAEQRLRSAMR